MFNLDDYQANPEPARSLRMTVVPPSRTGPVTERETTVIQNIITGGREVPPDQDWRSTVFVAGVGAIDFRVINGSVQLRGTLKQSITAAGSCTTVRQFPKGTDVYWPATDLNFATYAIDTGVAYRFGMVRITTAGVILLSAPTGKFDQIEFGGIEYTVY